jgi:hypothetical protein
MLQEQKWPCASFVIRKEKNQNQNTQKADFKALTLRWWQHDCSRGRLPLFGLAHGRAWYLSRAKKHLTHSVSTSSSSVCNTLRHLRNTEPRNGSYMPPYAFLWNKWPVLVFPHCLSTNWYTKLTAPGFLNISVREFSLPSLWCGLFALQYYRSPHLLSSSPLPSIEFSRKMLPSTHTLISAPAQEVQHHL